jgi:hypothetical protein
VLPDGVVDTPPPPLAATLATMMITMSAPSPMKLLRTQCRFFFFFCGG